MNLHFDRFELDRERHLLLEEGSPVHLGPKAFRLLEVLVGNRPRALSKQNLIDAVWPHTLVEESNLAGLVADLRTALHDDARNARFIRTVHGFGYAFCGETAETAERTRIGAIVFRGEESPLHAGENVLGRDPACDIVIDDSTVSRRHACVTAGEGEILIADLSSKNGTFVDGERIEAAVLVYPGQALVLGDARLMLKLTGMPGTTITRGPRST